MNHCRARTLMIVCTLCLLATSCVPESPAPDAPSSEELVRRYFEQVLNQGDTVALEGLLSNTFTLYVPPSLAPGPVVDSREAFAQMVKGLRTTFPDLHFTIEEVVSEPDAAMVSWTMRGTHSDVWLGVPATGRQITLTGVDVFRISEGRIREVRIHGDYLGVLRQLGALPE